MILLLAIALQAAVQPAPGPLATAADELNAAFTPDGKSVYFTRKVSKDSALIVVSHRRGERWSEPEVASFSGRAPDYDPFITPDGSRIFWMSKRSANGEPKNDFDLWMADRVGGGWGEPMRLPEPVNSVAGEFFPSVARNGTLYFSSNREGGGGRGDIYRSRLVDGGYRSVENLGPVVNSTGFDGDPLIAPDESFLIFTGWGRPGGDPEGDLYLSYRTDDRWSVPVALPPEINSPAQEYAPALSPDGRWFYFASYRGGKENGDVYRVRRSLVLRARD
jgi:Tol biopolymer transport system component